ncbi:uncharacterized protein LOC143768664 [Ranitomeya variabilis]|uniref:uncharacterized protein LOC143768664 n=1 Tax=Ranitomeya variabilis TaxID=490064 RepID=UPI0040567608
MKNLPLLSCLVLALIHYGHCLNCTSCFNTTSLTCTGSQVTCANDELCYLIIVKTSGSNTAGIERGCRSLQFCNTSYSYMNGSDEFDLSSTCCSDGDCIVPDSAFTRNGFQCPSLVSGVDNTPQVLQCLGNQNKCFNVTQIRGDFKFVLGCANDYVCSMNRSDTEVISCVNATSSPITTTITTDISTAVSSKGLRNWPFPPSSTTDSDIYFKGLFFLFGLFHVYASEIIVNLYI